MNYFIVTQIDENGNETGLTKLIAGPKETARFILSEEKNEERKKSIATSLEKMNPGDFDAINVDKFIYEIDCITEKEANDLDVKDDDIITEEKTAVYEIFYEEKNIKYAFGATDLITKLKEAGIETSDLPTDEEEKSYETNDPVHVSITVKKLDDREIEKLKKTSDSFMIDYEIAMSGKIEESTMEETVKDFEHGGFRIRITKLYNGKFAATISEPNSKRFISHASFFRTVEEAEKYAIDAIDNQPEFKKTVDAMKLNESNDDCSKLCKYCGHEIEAYNCDESIQCKISKNGSKVKNYRGFKSLEEAVEFGKSCIDFGINEDTNGGVMEIVVDVNVAAKANEAINDNPYLKGNVNWTSSNSFVFDYNEDDEDDSLLDEIVEQLNAFGITEDQYMIETPEEF